MLWVPLKSTSDVSYAPSIRQTITQTYQESADSYKEEISALDRCRQDALRGSAGSDVTGRDLLYKYFGQLELLELRFPDVRVPFPWKDAFTGKEISQLSLAYEKASVIFNIAATLSSLAAQQNRTSTEGIRRAFHNFRCAAGMFTYINDNFLHAPSTDLSREVVKVLVQLMIAQATEVFVERMTEEKEKKPFGLRARVSTQAAFLYGGVIEDVKELASKGIFERSWTWLVQCKHKYFVSLAQYQRSLADSASSKHGDALARLQIAEAAAKEASRYAHSFSTSFSATNSIGSATLPSDAATSLVELTRTHLTLCNEAKVSEQRDNDLIYHEALPSEAALPPIEKSSVGEPITIQEVYGAPEVQKVVGQDIFVRLVPLSVHQSSSLYSEEKAKLIRTEGERCETADTELVTALEFAGLPRNLDKFHDFIHNGSARLNEMTEPPSLVLEWSGAVQQAKAMKPIEKMWDELIGLRTKTHTDIENIERKLDTDARDCEQMRVQYDHLWEQQPSSKFTKAWRQSLKSHREALEAAKKSDNQIDEIWQSSKADLEILCDPTGESLRRTFIENVLFKETKNEDNLLDIDTNDEQSETSQMKNMITAIQENVIRLQAIKKERQGVLQDLKERIQADDISQLLILNRKAQNIEPALFAAELEKFQAHSGRISATIHLQSTAIQELTAHYKSLIESRQGKDVQERWASASKRRAQLTSRLQTAYQSHEEVRAGLSKGIQFYHEIQAAISEIQRQIESFVSNRLEERIRLATQAEAERNRNATAHGDTHSLEHQMTRMNLSNSSGSPAAAAGPAPPPLPPPPPRPWQPTANPNPTGPACQHNPPYQSSSDRPPMSTSQPHYTSSIPPSVDPYASLGAFGSMFPSSTTGSNSQSHSAPNQPLAHQNSGPAPPPVPHQYPGPTQPLAPHHYLGKTISPVPPQQFSGQVQSTAPMNYSGSQPAPTVPRHYSAQGPPPHPGQFYSQFNAYQANPEGPSSAAASKSTLPPPPPPVTYQSAMAQTSNPNHPPYNPSTHHHPHAYHQPLIPSSNGPPHYPSASSQSRPSVMPPPPPPPQQPYYPSNTSQPYLTLSHPIQHPRPADGSSAHAGPFSPTQSTQSSFYDPRSGGGWQQAQQAPGSYIPQNAYYPNPAPPPPSSHGPGF